VVLFGGERWFGGSNLKSFNDVWLLDLTPGGERWTLTTACGTPPPARAYASAVLDALNYRMILLGGRNDVGAWVDGVWFLDLAPGSGCWSHMARELPFDGVDWAGAFYDMCPGADRLVNYNNFQVWSATFGQSVDDIAWHEIATGGERVSGRNDPA
jgi:hypothetical protein